MHPDFFKFNPFRQPDWRAERVWKLVTQRPNLLRPRHYDDRYVRSYYGYLVSSLANGKDDESQGRVRAQRPYVYHAHEMYFAADRQRRQLLEARLLTEEPFERIAEWFDLDPLTIEFYEALFFNVRDRLECRDWIAKVIKGPPEDSVPNQNGTFTDGQRGYVYRLFAYHGGAKVLSALVDGMLAGPMPGPGEDLECWFAESQAGIISVRAAAAASVLTVNAKNVTRLIRLALREAHPRNQTKPRRDKSFPGIENNPGEILAAISKQWGAEVAGG